MFPGQCAGGVYSLGAVGFVVGLDQLYGVGFTADGHGGINLIGVADPQHFLETGCAVCAGERFNHTDADDRFIGFSSSTTGQCACCQAGRQCGCGNVSPVHHFGFSFYLVRRCARYLCVHLFPVLPY